MKSMAIIGSCTAIIGIAALAYAISAVIGSGASADSGTAKGTFHNATGGVVGTAKLSEDEGVVLVKVKVEGLAPGFHGFHVHAVGECVAPFTSAGGHYNPGAVAHPAHAADMPVLLVNDDGAGEARFRTDRFGVTELFDSDGSALIIHANPDNYANIPTARYEPDPDSTTLATGDAGPRAACAVIRGE